MHTFSKPATAALILFVSASAFAQPQGSAARRTEAIPSIDDRVTGLKKIDGFFPMFWDDAGGHLFVEIPKLDTEVLHSTGFGTGLGSNDIGIDRGALTGARIIKFERVGPRILMVQPNCQYRGTSSNPAEVRDVTEAFARSVLWSFAVAAASEGHALVRTNTCADHGHVGRADRHLRLSRRRDQAVSGQAVAARPAHRRA